MQVDIPLVLPIQEARLVVEQFFIPIVEQIILNPESFFSNTHNFLHCNVKEKRNKSGEIGNMYSQLNLTTTISAEA